MILQAVLLCDAATIRDGLISLLGGGITRFTGMEFPLSLNATLAAVVICENDGREHQFGVVVVAQSTEGPVATVTGSFVAMGFAEAEMVNVPLAVDLRQVGLPVPGSYDIRVNLDYDLAAILPISAGPGG